MKSLSYILLTFLLFAICACSEEDHPYVGYIQIERAVLEASVGSVTVVADTDISSPIEIETLDENADWCTISINGKEITATATQANPSSDSNRTASYVLRCGYRLVTFNVIQKYEGQDYLALDWSTWTATGSGFAAGDGGGYPSLFTDDRTQYWHSQYNPPTVPPFRLEIDMKAELDVAMIQIGRRLYADNGNNYGTVKTMEIYASTDNENYTQVGGFTFTLPWTAPDGTVVTGTTSPLIPAYEEIRFAEDVKARYFRLIITEVNTGNNACQVAFFKPYQRI